MLRDDYAARTSAHRPTVYLKMLVCGDEYLKNLYINLI